MKCLDKANLFLTKREYLEEQTHKRQEVCLVFIIIQLETVIFPIGLIQLAGLTQQIKEERERGGGGGISTAKTDPCLICLCMTVSLCACLCVFCQFCWLEKQV